MKLYLIFILSFFLVSTSIYCQNYINYEKEALLYHFDSEKFEIIDSGNTIIAKSVGKQKATFQYSFDIYSLCEGGSAEFYCAKCIDSNLEDALYDDEVNWVKKDSITYISKNRVSFTSGLSKNRQSVCTKLEVIRTPGKEIKLTLVYSKTIMLTSDWKKLKKLETVKANN
jgi:hypothetical protein